MIVPAQTIDHRERITLSSYAITFQSCSFPTGIHPAALLIYTDLVYALEKPSGLRYLLRNWRELQSPTTNTQDSNPRQPPPTRSHIRKGKTRRTAQLFLAHRVPRRQPLIFTTARQNMVTPMGIFSPCRKDNPTTELLTSVLKYAIDAGRYSKVATGRIKVIHVCLESAKSRNPLYVTEHDLYWQ